MCFRRKPKEIIPNLNISSKEIVAFQKLKKGKIFIGTKIKIPRNYAFAICSNNSVLDVLYEGLTILDIKSLPNSTRRFSLYKINKRGKSPKFFEADAYFINLNKFEDFKWETAEYADLEDKKYGEYKSSCFGTLKFGILEPSKFLNYLLKNSEIIYSAQVEKFVNNYINERIVRILNKLNPTAKNLYLKDKEIIKTLYEKLSELLSEIGIELIEISLTETKFPPKILADLRDTTESPSDIRMWGKSTFEDWQNENPATEGAKKPKFVTITPTGKSTPFFEESMAPYFFDDAEEVKKDVETEKTPAPVWKGVDEKIIEEKSKQLVDLDNIESDKPSDNE